MLAKSSVLTSCIDVPVKDTLWNLKTRSLVHKLNKGLFLLCSYFLKGGRMSMWTQKGNIFPFTKVMDSQNRLMTSIVKDQSHFFMCEIICTSACLICMMWDGGFQKCLNGKVPSKEPQKAQTNGKFSSVWLNQSETGGGCLQSTQRL